MRAKALLYRLGEETETGERLRAILRRRSILALSVGETQLDETVARLVAANAAPESAEAAPDAPDTPFLLLSALGERQLDRLLADMRREGVSVPHKAVVTETNRAWTLRALMREVAREHEAMRQT